MKGPKKITHTSSRRKHPLSQCVTEWAQRRIRHGERADDARWAARLLCGPGGAEMNCSARTAQVCRCSCVAGKCFEVGVCPINE
jgi:hypothetical protein